MFRTQGTLKGWVTHQDISPLDDSDQGDRGDQAWAAAQAKARGMHLKEGSMKFEGTQMEHKRKSWVGGGNESD